MLKIGEFASLTGLSVKALRHYDEKVVLVPADVDAQSGYRRYGESQVRDGVMVQALREAGVPLPAVAVVVAAGDANGALLAHRRRVLSDREKEDRAFAMADQYLRALAVPVSVEEREKAAQPFVGQTISVDVDDADALSDEDANAVFTELFEQLHQSGHGPSGQFWTSLREGERGTVELVCCWPTPEKVDDTWGGADVFSGVLPARKELVATWRPDEGEMLPQGAAHPALVGLFDRIGQERLGIQGPVEVRQHVLGQSDENYAVEICVTVENL